MHYISRYFFFYFPLYKLYHEKFSFTYTLKKVITTILCIHKVLKTLGPLKLPAAHSVTLQPSHSVLWSFDTLKDKLGKKICYPIVKIFLIFAGRLVWRHINTRLGGGSRGPHGFESYGVWHSQPPISQSECGDRATLLNVVNFTHK